MNFISRALEHQIQWYLLYLYFHIFLMLFHEFSINRMIQVKNNFLKNNFLKNNFFLKLWCQSTQFCCQQYYSYKYFIVKVKNIFSKTISLLFENIVPKGVSFFHEHIVLKVYSFLLENGKRESNCNLSILRFDIDLSSPESDQSTFQTKKNWENGLAFFFFFLFLSNLINEDMWWVSLRSNGIQKSR